MEEVMYHMVFWNIRLNICLCKITVKMLYFRLSKGILKAKLQNRYEVRASCSGKISRKKESFSGKISRKKRKAFMVI